MPGVVVDGQDVDVVNGAVAEAIDRARGGGGPTLLEMKTYRYRGHSRADPARYRPEGELERWKERDPIELLGARLADEGRLSTDDLTRMRSEVQDEIDAAAERAQASPVPTLVEIGTYVYAD
jgi:pyruvate dehydrogenase E1 component alpha subunit